MCAILKEFLKFPRAFLRVKKVGKNAEKIDTTCKNFAFFVSDFTVRMKKSIK